jgi:hypothetical protein
VTLKRFALSLSSVLCLLSSAFGQTTISKSTALQDGTTASQKASVSAGGALKVDNSGVTQPASQSGNWIMRLQGNAGAIIDFAGQNASAPANSILIGGEFNTSPTTITSGNASPLQLDSAGNLLIKLNLALPAGGNTIGAVTQASGPWTENQTQLNGTTVDTNSGNKSAGTQRVVIATDQPALTNALKVDGSAVTQPVSQSGNWTMRLQGNAGAIIDFAGQNATAPANSILIGGEFNTTPTTITTGNASPLQLDSSGNLLVNVKSGSTGNAAAGNTGSAVPTQTDYSGVNVAGTLRGWTAVNPSGSIFAGQIDWASIAGTTVDTNSGTKSAGTQRVVIATDQPSLTNALPVSQNGNWTMRLQGNAGAIIDFAGQNAVAPANSILIGGEFNTSPTTITSGNASPLQMDASGNLLVNVKAGSSGNGAASNTGSAVPAQGDYSGINVGGTLRGQTGANPSGSIYAAQTDVASVAGTTVDTNSGNKSAGTQRVVIATDQPSNTNALKVDNSGVTQPTSQADPAVTSGSITTVDAGSTTPASLIAGQSLITGSATANSTVSASVSGVSSFSVQLSGTWTGTVQFEKSIDGGTTWASVGLNGVGATGTVTTVTGAGANANALLHGNAGNLTNVRVRCTAYTSGTVTVKIQPSYGVFSVLASQNGAPWSDNVSQINGTTTDTNSGNKSAGTLRVVLATDQPQPTSKFLVTPDSVALPAHQSTNVDQVNGTTTDTNSGNKSAGTLRVVLATDQPALNSKLLVTPDSVALPAHQSTNVDQVNGTTTDTNSGTKSAGTQRMVLATDQPTMTNAQPVTPQATESYLGFVGGKATNVAANFTRPADTNVYASGDLVANSVTAASVVPLSFTMARINDASGMIRRVRLKISGTVITNASFRIHFYRNDPSASSGIANGDNGVWSTKEAGYLGSCDVTVDKAFTDAAEGVGIPNNGTEINFIPTSGAQTVYALIEARAAFTPISAEVFTVTAEILQN